MYYTCQDCEGEITDRIWTWCPWCGEKIQWNRVAFYSDDEGGIHELRG